MVKKYCDMCGVQIDPSNECSITSTVTKDFKKMPSNHTETLTLKVTIANDMTTEDAFCKYCVIDTIAKLDDRPRAI